MDAPPTSAPPARHQVQIIPPRLTRPGGAASRRSMSGPGGPGIMGREVGATGGAVMSAEAPAGETILIVDDEDSVRKTFLSWLEGADLGCRTLSAADAEGALRLAEQSPIDLAILDWNLGAGNDGLQ